MQRRISQSVFPRNARATLVRVVGASACSFLVACSGGETPEPPLEPGDAARPDLVPQPAAPVALDLEGLECGDVAAVPSEGRLLTRLQYQNSVVDLFDGKIAGNWVLDFPAENEVMGYRTNAQFHRATPWLVEAHLVAAEAIAAQVVRQLDGLLPCSAHASDGDRAHACADELLERYASRAFRRPLAGAERAVFLDLFDGEWTATSSFRAAAQLVVEAILQSPQFLYRVEPPGDGSDAELSDYELAARLSYLLWNTIPDEELWQAASSGTLREPTVLRAHAERLLDSPRAGATVADFTEQWLGLANLTSAVRRVGVTVSEQGVSVPLVDNRYSSAWQTSLTSFVRHLVTSGGTFEELFRSPTIFVNRELATLYGSAVPDSSNSDAFFPVMHPESERTGLLSQPALMALLSHPDQSAPILRGAFVREVLLCDPPPPPPPTVDPTPPALDPEATTRERFAQHTSSTACSGCHRLIDPIGLGLENYDELGRFRTEENGRSLDVSGEIVKAREEQLDGPFVGPHELSLRLASSKHARACLVTQWYRYGMGRVEQAVDLCSIRQAYDRLSDSEGNLRQMLLGLVESDAFRRRGATPGGQP